MTEIVAMDLSCPLCMQPPDKCGPLSKSHIIPRFLIKRSKGLDGKCVGFLDDGRTLKLSQADWKEPLLCAQCETFLSKTYETPISKMLFQGQHRSAVFKPSAIETRNFSPKIAILAALSILWRAAIATQSEFQRVVLPKHAVDGLRRAIFEGYVDRQILECFDIAYGWVVQPNNELLEVMHQPYAAIEENGTEFVFTAGGVIITIGVPGKMLRNSYGMKTVRIESENIRISRIQLKNIPILSSAVDDMLKAYASPDFLKKVDDHIDKSHPSTREKS